jgi:uncharacterized OB-fold protein
MLIKERKLVAPTVYPETKAFWDAAGEGRLLVKQCDDCGEHHHYPRAACPFCDAVRIGQAVTLKFNASEGGPPMPVFTPA